MRTRAKQDGLPDARTLIERALASAESKASDAGKTLSEAVAQAEHARTRFYEDGSLVNREQRRNAEEDLDRAQHLAKQADAALASAREALARHRREEALQKYEAAKQKVLALKDVVAERAQVLVALDRQVDGAVLEIARAVAEASDAHAEAEAIASELGMTADLDRTTVRPDVHEARLQVTRAITQARAEEQREDTSPWLAGVPDDWRTRDRSAREHREILTFAQLRERGERQAQLAMASAIGAMKAGETAPKARPLTTPGPGETD
jgi:hypothetical protein